MLILVGFTSHRVYSVYFRLLAKFPGPKLVAATLWYGFYYDVILKGQHTFKIKELHQKYGIGLLFTCYTTKLIVTGPLFELVYLSSISTSLTTTKSFTRSINRGTNTFSTPASLTIQKLLFQR
jgi:hypothetical protein